MATQPVRSAIAIPQVVNKRGAEPAALATFLAQAEALGYESAWVMNPVFDELRHLELLAGEVVPAVA